MYLVHTLVLLGLSSALALAAKPTPTCTFGRKTRKGLATEYCSSFIASTTGATTVVFPTDNSCIATAGAGKRQVEAPVKRAKNPILPCLRALKSDAERSSACSCLVATPSTVSSAVEQTATAFAIKAGYNNLFARSAPTIGNILFFGNESAADGTPFTLDSNSCQLLQPNFQGTASDKAAYGCSTGSSGYVFYRTLSCSVQPALVYCTIEASTGAMDCSDTLGSQSTAYQLGPNYAWLLGTSPPGNPTNLFAVPLPPV